MASAAVATKIKCMYWEKCYRKDPNHKNEYLHPGDVKDEETDDEDAKGDVAMDTTPSPTAKTPKKRAAHEMSLSDGEVNKYLIYLYMLKIIKTAIQVLPLNFHNFCKIQQKLL